MSPRTPSVESAKKRELRTTVNDLHFRDWAKKPREKAKLFRDSSHLAKTLGKRDARLFVQNIDEALR